MIKFTILVAVYNASSFLDKCLDSLSRQTEKNFQAICIDDCSTDGSLSILHRRAAADSRFEVMQTPQNSGQAVARNLGLTRAQGELTLMLDADDWLGEDALARLWADFEREPEADAIVFSLMKTWADGRMEPYPVQTGRRTLSGREAALLSIDWRIHGYYAIRTSIHRRLPYLDSLKRYSDDNTTFLHYLHSKRVVLSGGTYYYLQHEASCTHVFDLGRLDFLDANMELRRLLEDNGVSGEGLHRCEMYCWYNLAGLYREMLLQKASFSPDGWREVERRFARALKAVRPLRLSRRVFRHPSTAYVYPYSLFRLWQRLILKLRPAEKKG